jgi:hypothetical protein
MEGPGGPDAAPPGPTSGKCNLVRGGKAPRACLSRTVTRIERTRAEPDAPRNVRAHLVGLLGPTGATMQGRVLASHER